MTHAASGFEQVLAQAYPHLKAFAEANGLTDAPYVKWPAKICEEHTLPIREWIKNDPKYKPNQMILDGGGSQVFDENV
jgi:hypothetical protein